jgi:hypothetical protein
MPEISTDYLAEQIEATNERIATGIEDLDRKVEDGQKELMAFRLDRTDKVSAIRKSLWWAKAIAVAVIVPDTVAIAPSHIPRSNGPWPPPLIDPRRSPPRRGQLNHLGFPIAF